MSAKTNQMALALARALGYHVDIVERRIGGGGFSYLKDCFGFADLLLVPKNDFESRRPSLVQVTSVSNGTTRRKKVAESKIARACVSSKLFVEVWLVSKRYPPKGAQWPGRKGPDKCKIKRWCVTTHFLSEKGEFYTGMGYVYVVPPMGKKKES